MSENVGTYHGQVVEEEIHLTLSELCRACGMGEENVTAWVFEGVLEPSGREPQEWRFGGMSLHRARVATRLTHDLDINPAALALVVDLLDEIETLRARLKRHGPG